MMTNIIPNELIGVWKRQAPHSSITPNGLLLDRYTPLTLLGVGGTSVVISARDTVLHRPVAVKILDPDIVPRYYLWGRNQNTEEFDWTEQFRAEARRLASHKHFNICEIYDFGVTADKVPWMVMELFDGDSLRDQLRRWETDTSSHSIETILSIGKQIASAVDYLHRSNLCLLDIKPENILIRDGRVKLIDVASAVERPRPGYDIRAARFGTPGYVAPEVIASPESHIASPQADVFSIGTVLLEMCCLHNPLYAPELRELAYRAMRVSETDRFLDYFTVVCPPRWDEQLERWSEQYRHAIEKIDVRNLLIAASFRVPQPLVNLIGDAMRVSRGSRPRNGGDVLQRLAPLYRQGDKIAKAPTTPPHASAGVPGPNASTNAPGNEAQVFVSYAHQDAEWLKRLQVHLKPLIRQGVLALWDDTKIKPGAAWRREIEQALSSASVAVLLVSADFLASDFVAENELPPLLDRAAKGGLQIMSVIVGPCLFQSHRELSQYQAVNPPSEPLTKMQRHEAEEILVKLAETIANHLTSQ